MVPQIGYIMRKDNSFKNKPMTCKAEFHIVSS